MHVNNALREELQGMATVAKFAIVQNEGGRTDLHTQHHATTCPRPAAPQCAIPSHRHRCVPKRPRPLLCIDDTVYHIGASLKDLGKKWFAFSRLEIGTEALRKKM